MKVEYIRIQDSCDVILMDCSKPNVLQVANTCIEINDYCYW